MTTFKKLSLSVLAGTLFLSTSAHATDSSLIILDEKGKTAEVKGAETLDDTSSQLLSGQLYVRKNVQQQCEAYRTIFDPLFKKAQEANPSALTSTLLKNTATTHAPGLIDIFKDGVLIARDYISSHSPEKDSKEFLNELKKIWEKASESDEKNYFDAISFIEMNVQLATIVSRYKLENSASETLNFENDRPVFIIYAHPDAHAKARGLSMATFVNQYVGNGLYPAWLALFDVHCNQRIKGRKKDPHYSIANGVFEMLFHDFDHIHNPISEQKFEAFKYIKAGQAISQHLRRAGNSTDAHVIEGGLFLLFHESAIIAFKAMPGQTEIEVLKQAGKTFLSRYALPRFDEHFSGKFTEYLENFKIIGRDNESVLKFKNKDGNPFLSTIAMGNNKQRALPIAKQGENYFIIQKPEDFKEDMTWVYSDVPEAIRMERHKILSPIIMRAFEDFWGRFNELLDEGSKL